MGVCIKLEFDIRPRDDIHMQEPASLATMVPSSSRVAVLLDEARVGRINEDEVSQDKVSTFLNL